jgi:hypothetical protein
MSARRMIEAVFIRRVLREFRPGPRVSVAAPVPAEVPVTSTLQRDVAADGPPVYSNLSPALLPLSTRNRLVETSTGEPPDKEPTK